MLRLQPDEALNSFYSRNIFFLQQPTAKNLRDLFGICTTDHWRRADFLRFINKAGWPGREGLNFFLYRHTSYHRVNFSVFEFVAYDRRIYRINRTHILTNYIGTNLVRFCPLCIREDFEELGFIYWRRNHQSRDVKVCARHNSILVDSCEECSKPYEEKSKYLETPWSGCECGFCILDTKVEFSPDSGALMFSSFLDGIYSSEYQVNTWDQYKAVEARLESLGLSSAADYYDYFADVLNKDLLRRLLFSAEGRDWCKPLHLFQSIYQYTAVLFSSFEDFSLSLDDIGAKKYPLSKSCYDLAY